MRTKILNEIKTTKMERNSVLAWSSKKLLEERIPLLSQKNWKVQQMSWKRRHSIIERDHEEQNKRSRKVSPTTGILHVL
jgi:hypothetical protein